MTQPGPIPGMRTIPPAGDDPAGAQPPVAGESPQAPLTVEERLAALEQENKRLTEDNTKKENDLKSLRKSRVSQTDRDKSITDAVNQVALRRWIERAASAPY